MIIRSPSVLAPDLSESYRFHPVSGSATLNLMSASEASMALPDGDPCPGIHDWVSVYARRGLLGIFRVTNVARNYLKQSEITMLHGIDILSDSVWQAQLDFSGTKAEFIAALLNQQTQLVNGVKPWVLGTCADPSAYKRAINYDRLSDLFWELVEEGGSYCWTFDQSSFPWTVNYTALTDTVTSEFRLTRNVRSATTTFNDADLCTRLILSVNVKSEDADTAVTSSDAVIRVYDNAAAQAVWGTVIKTADIDTDDDIAHGLTPEADAWAADFLAKRAAPSVQIQVDGDELAAMTGENWDACDLGRLCQVAMPAYGSAFQERVVSIAYPDLYRDRDDPADVSHVTVSLSNQLPKFTENIADIRKTANAAAKSARAGGRGAASAKDLTSWAQRVKYQGAALDGTGITTLYESGISMDAAGGVKIYSLVEGVQSLYSGIQVNANEITHKVSNGKIASTINQTAQEVLIQASKINLSGYVTASQLRAVSADLDNLVNGTTRATQISTNYLYAYTRFNYLGTAVSWVNKTVKDGDGNNVIIHYLGYSS